MVINELERTLEEAVLACFNPLKHEVHLDMLKNAFISSQKILSPLQGLTGY
jgi:hypothetical protein